MDKADICDPTADLGPIFTAISNRRRRMFIRLVAEAGPMPPRDAADHIAWAESEYDDIDDVPRSRGHAVYVTLQQDHLPKLTPPDILVVTDGNLSPGQNFTRANCMLQTIAAHEANGDGHGDA